MNSILLYSALLFVICLAAQSIPKVAVRKMPLLTIGLCSSLALCLLFQYANPWVLPALERNAIAIQGGEWWRIITALFFQDGGIWGGLANIIFLGIIGSIAETIWKRKEWIAIYAVAGITGEFIGLAWQPIGAGNSVAVFGLAASVCMYVFSTRARMRARIASGIGVMCACALLLQKDIHGAAFLIGAAVSILLLALRRMSAGR